MLKKLLTTIVLITIGLSSNLFSQDCENALEDALENLGQQRYNMIIALLTDCPPALFLERTQKIMAYELLAQAYFNMNQVDSSRAALNHLLDLQSEFDPRAPQYSEGFIGLLEDVKDIRARQENRSILRNKWFWVGSVAVTSVTAFFVFGKKDKTAAVLPEAPDPPVRQ